MNRLGHFHSDKQQGDSDEVVILDNLISKGYEVEKASLQEDKNLGIDYWISKNNTKFSIQIKCDRQISKYNNFYMQTSKCIGNPAKGKKVEASRFLYFDVINRKMYDMATKDIQANWDDITAIGKHHQKAQTNGSLTEGYIISIEKLKALIPMREVQL